MTQLASTSFIVKICGLTSIEDARAAVEAGANALGFNFYPKSPRYVSVEQAARIASAVPGEWLRVGVFVNPAEDELRAAIAAVPLDVIQIHGAMPATLHAGVQVWKAVAANDVKKLSASATRNLADAILVDTPSANFGGTGEVFDWQLATGLSIPVILAGGLHAANVAEAINKVHPFGVDACSRLESSPGRKDHTLTSAFIQNASAAAALLPQILEIKTEITL